MGNERGFFVGYWVKRTAAYVLAFAATIAILEFASAFVRRVACG